MKKLLSLLLAAALLGALAAPAAASADDRLAQVTVKVKSTLGIGDEYEEFYGDYWENELAPTWSLHWSREDASLTAEATEAGKVLYYSLSESSLAYQPQGFRPAFPAVDRAQAQAAAEAFLAKVLDSPLETAQFNPQTTPRLDTESHRFSGSILLNGLPSPLSFSVTVRAGDGQVIRFSRDSLEGGVIGGVPSPTPAAARGSAGALLKGTLSLRLEYVLDQDDTRAVLRYLPNYGDEFYVDAQTGELVNLTELYEKLSEDGFASGGGSAAADEAESAPAGAAADNGLSDVEREGVAKLEGVLSKEELDQRLQALSPLGLGRYTLASASYSLDQETDEVTARLVYSRKDGQGVWRRTVTADGKTGELLALSSSAPYDEERQAQVEAGAAQAAAEDFLSQLWGGEFGQTALKDSRSWTQGSWGASHSFTYTRQANGYFLPANSLEVSVDVTDGSISSLRRTWTEELTFDSPEGIVSESAALDAWFDHYDVILAYRNVPVRLDPNSGQAKPLIDMGLSYFYGLVLSYALEQENYAYGVDAKTGAVVSREQGASSGALIYDDLEGHWARTQIQALAQYGVGWTGGSFQPGKPLTQIDLAALLVSTQGYRYDPETGDPDRLYDWAYQLGLLAPADRRDGELVTRGEVIQLLLDGAGYGEVAALPGIFTCSFTDQADIPAALYGYAALAQGMGLVGGDENGRFAAGRLATRAEAAVILYQFMSR